MASSGGLGGHGDSSASVGTMVNNFYRSLPLCTKTVFTVVMGLWLFSILNLYDQHAVCLNPQRTVMSLEVYRILTSIFVHGGLLHVTFNMLAFVPMGSSLERLVGTLQFAHMMLVITVVGAALYSFVAFTVGFSGLMPSIMHDCAVGLSGVIFGLIVIDNHQTQATHRSIFGLFSVPALWYPYALLLFCQLVPNTSFLGHLCGLLVGQAWVWGWLGKLTLSRPTTAWLESSTPVERWLVPKPSFIMMPGPVLPYTTQQAGGGGGGGRGAVHAGPASGTSEVQSAFASAFSPIMRIFSKPAPRSSSSTTTTEERPGGSSLDHCGGASCGAAGTYQGAGRTVGGSKDSMVAPRSAAAAAAEARAQKGTAS